MTICVLGLGNMGLPIALNLARAGHTVRGANLAPVPQAEEADVAVFSDGAEALQGCDTVLCLLPDIPYLEPLLPAVEAGGATDLVVMSTVSPLAVRNLAERLEGRVRVVDACMSGGVPRALDGTMSIMCGGAQEDFERVRPLLEIIGGMVRLMGPLGAGAVTKACNQMVVAGTLVALAEATLVAQENDIDPGAMLDVLGAGLAGSVMLDQMRDKLAHDDFTPDGPARFLVKDLGFAADSAHGRELPSLAVSRDLFTALTDEGLGDLDKAVVLRYLREHTTPTADAEAPAGTATTIPTKD